MFLFIILNWIHPFIHKLYISFICLCYNYLLRMFFLLLSVCYIFFLCEKSLLRRSDKLIFFWAMTLGFRTPVFHWYVSGTGPIDCVCFLPPKMSTVYYFITNYWQVDNYFLSPIFAGLEREKLLRALFFESISLKKFGVLTAKLGMKNWNMILTENNLSEKKKIKKKTFVSQFILYTKIKRWK